MATIRVLIVDDHVLFADVIASALAKAGMSIVGVAPTAEAALSMFELERPEMVLMDLGLPDETGIEAGRQIIERSLDTKVVALTARSDRWAIDDARKARFAGFISKNTGISDFVEAVKAVAEGRVTLLRGESPRTKRTDDGGAALLAEQLTSREREVLALLVQGASGEAIAKPLGISPNTVRTHVQSILTKLQVHSRLEAAAFAVRHSLVADPTGSTTYLRSTGSDQ